MKIIKFLMLILILFASQTLNAQNSNSINPDVLIGEWILDMSPYDKTDNNFAQMKITRATNMKMEGTFYREGVSMKNAQINTQTNLLYAALVSGDNSGIYNTSFYYKEGILYGSTHALERDFLAVWTAERRK
ncbi:hypothetical protein HZR84_06250 [Hyphobacterium sp. CCMP332]|nr:hypothetical protein HZR84_06250 [Hyphobacterium sp. CCMP332]